MHAGVERAAKRPTESVCDEKAAGARPCRVVPQVQPPPGTRAATGQTHNRRWRSEKRPMIGPWSGWRPFATRWRAPIHTSRTARRSSENTTFSSRAPGSAPAIEGSYRFTVKKSAGRPISIAPPGAPRLRAPATVAVLNSAEAGSGANTARAPRSTRRLYSSRRASSSRSIWVWPSVPRAKPRPPQAAFRPAAGRSPGFAPRLGRSKPWLAPLRAAPRPRRSDGWRESP